MIRQWDSRQSFEDFLRLLMRTELEQRQESTRLRKMKVAHLSYTKTLEEFDCSRLEHVLQANIRELASCNFVSKKQNIVMIGNPGTGKTHLLSPLELRCVCRG